MKGVLLLISRNQFTSNLFIWEIISSDKYYLSEFNDASWHFFGHFEKWRLTSEFM